MNIDYFDHFLYEYMQMDVYTIDDEQFIFNVLYGYHFS